MRNPISGSRGGSSNAYTASEHTNFHFDVPSEHFESALARFVSFFVCPIFRESNVQAELDIVESEHEKNRWNDLWRTNQVNIDRTQGAHGKFVCYVESSSLPWEEGTWVEQ